ncbi:MAG: hypothetical protein V1889_00495 [archaeon]
MGIGRGKLESFALIFSAASPPRAVAGLECGVGIGKNFVESRRCLFFGKVFKGIIIT